MDTVVVAFGYPKQHSKQRAKCVANISTIHQRAIFGSFRSAYMDTVVVAFGYPKQYSKQCAKCITIVSTVQFANHAAQ